MRKTCMEDGDLGNRSVRNFQGEGKVHSELIFGSAISKMTKLSYINHTSLSISFSPFLILRDERLSFHHTLQLDPRV